MSQKYVRDVDTAIALVAANYAGYADKETLLGAAVIDAANAQARAQAQLAATDEDCARVLAEYLLTFRDGHVSAVYFDEQRQMRNAKRLLTQAGSVEQPPSYVPTAQRIGDDIVLLTIPSFDIRYKEAIDALIQQNEAALARCPYLIVDVRGNRGGTDSAYFGLLPYLYTDPIVRVGMNLLATKANADAWEAILSQIPSTETDIIAQIKAEVAQMRAAPEGTFLATSEDIITTFPDVLDCPSHVAILIDGKCASTTEEFLLAARQSRKVTTFGQTTEGILDYANVRLFPLPSGERLLQLATTRSRRLPTHPIDNIGVAPDVAIAALKKPGDADGTAITFVKDYWKSG